MAYSHLLSLAKGMALMHNYVSVYPSKFHFEASSVSKILCICTLLLHG